MQSSGSMSSTNDLQCMKMIRLVRNAASQINSLQYITLTLEKRNGSTCGYNGRTGMCEEARLMKERGPKISLFVHADAHWLFSKMTPPSKSGPCSFSATIAVGRDTGKNQRQNLEVSEHKIGYPINAGAWSNARMLFWRRLLIPGKKSQWIRSLLEPDRPDHETSLMGCFSRYETYISLGFTLGFTENMKYILYHACLSLANKKGLAENIL